MAWITFNCGLSKLQPSVDAEQYGTPQWQIKGKQGDIPSLKCKQDRGGIYKGLSNGMSTSDGTQTYFGDTLETMPFKWFS